MLDKRKCVICGCEFQPKSGSQKLCGNPECAKERKRQYAREHAEMYRECNRRHREQERVKKYRAVYDRLYQIQHKEQIQQYKRFYWQKKRFFNYLDKGKLLKNTYWYSLSSEDKQQVLDKLGI